MTALDCFLGVDGGGTKTRFALIDGEGRVLAQAQHGTTYHPQVGFEAVREILTAGVHQVLQEAGLPGATIRYAFFGLPAYGEDRHATSLLQAIPRAVLGHERYACDNDMVCGWAGSLACSDGINIIAGTGSIADALRRSLGFTDDEIVPLSYSGGAFSAGDLLMIPFKESLRSASPNFELRAPLHEPHYGAAIYAAKLFRNPDPA